MTMHAASAKLDATSAFVDTKPIVEAVLREPWEYTEADTQHLTHNIHRYSGKFIPQIAGRVIGLVTQPGELVVDPYCGSGTTLVEAALLRRRALGLDLNPLAVLIARVKITPVARKELDALRRHLEGALSERTNDSLPLFRSASVSGSVASDPRCSDEWFRKWFQPAILADLIAIDQAIAAVRNTTLQDIARVAFSDILRRSSNAHSGYPNVTFHKDAPPRTPPLRPFLKALDRACEMVSSLDSVEAHWSDVCARRGNAVAVPLDDSSADAVVSHPPYVGSIPYAEYGALSLKWLGFDPRQLDRELTGGRRQSPDVLERFREGYCQMLRESARVLKPGRFVFLIVGNPVVRGELIDLPEMTTDLAVTAGLRLVVRAQRQGVNRRANKMGCEHLLFFQKPPTVAPR